MTWTIRMLTTRLRSAFVAGLILIEPLFSQSLSVRGPDGGHVFDAQAQSVRRVVGLLGSAHVGDAALEGVRFASIAPDGRHALALLDRGMALVPDLRTPPAVPDGLSKSIDQVDRVLWARDSASAVLFSSSRRSLQFLRGLLSQPEVSAPIDLSPVGDTVSLLASDSSGKALVTSGNNTYLVSESFSPRLLPAIDRPLAAAFGEDGSLYLATESHQLFVFGALDESAASPLRAQILSLDLGNPVAVAVRKNVVFIADGRDQKIRAFDSATFAKLDEFDVDAPPSSLEWFAPDTFLLNARREPGSPVLLLRTSEPRRVVFIPSGE